MAGTPNEPIVYLNGDFVPLSEAKISVLDQGFLLGDGIFDVVSAWRGSIFKLDQHIDRFFDSLRATRLETPMTRENWRAAIVQTCRRNGLGDASIRFIVTRGAPNAVVADPRDFEPTRIVWAAPYIFLADEEARKRGIRLHITHLRAFCARHPRCALQVPRPAAFADGAARGAGGGLRRRDLARSRGLRLRGAGVQHLRGEGRRGAHAGAQRAARHHAPDLHRARRRRGHPAARGRPHPLRPLFGRRGLHLQHRRRRARRARDRRPAPAAALPRPGHPAAGSGSTGRSATRAPTARPIFD